jgi:hypothetical protein
MNTVIQNSKTFKTLSEINIIVEELKDFIFAIETNCDKETPIDTYKEKAQEHLTLIQKKVNELNLHT